MINFHELESFDFENSKLKNKLIRYSNKEWIGYADNSVTDKEEVCRILDEIGLFSEYDAIVFGKNCNGGEVELLDLLECPQSVVYALCFRREILVRSGSFNELLQGNTNYEFLLRVAEVGKVYVINCDADKEIVVDAYAMAYIVRRYMSFLKKKEG